MPDSQPSTPIPFNANLRAVLPIGIPLGWSPASQERRFRVRRSGNFCLLDEEGYELWVNAWLGPDSAALVDQLAIKWKREPEKVAADLTRFCEGRLLIKLVGDWQDDWLRVSRLRLIPRVAIVDGDITKGFQMLLAGGQLEMRMDVGYYSVWAFWDGTSTIEDSVAAAAEFSGLPRRVLQERAHSLLVACVRASAIFLDSTDKGD